MEYILTFDLEEETRLYILDGSISGTGVWCCASISKSKVVLESRSVDSKYVTADTKMIVYGIKY